MHSSTYSFLGLRQAWRKRKQEKPKLDYNKEMEKLRKTLEGKRNTTKQGKCND